MPNGKLKAKKIKAPQTNDDTSSVSSIHSNVSRALRVRMPNKPKKIVVPAPLKQPSKSTNDFALPLTLPQTSIVVAEPPSSPKSKAAIRATTTTQPSLKRKRSSPSITESDEFYGINSNLTPKSVSQQRTIMTTKTPNLEKKTAKKEQVYSFNN